MYAFQTVGGENKEVKENLINSHEAEREGKRRAKKRQFSQIQSQSQPNIVLPKDRIAS